ncbi:MAG TPA: dihydroneopterin triphosphate diphosphatase [Rhodocyclaceae bacterium]|nr:dihydroneopterin triphosphate diphosphatase [Rhodocyclaceae bacterium]HRQ47976.1 dihydroneopterin triphosphate diphosphatase [Rhodocyclaceae bacterium]
MNGQQCYKRPESVLVVIHTPDVEVLLIERICPRGFWQSVTGSLEPGEMPLQAALRELYEETGIVATAEEMRDWQQTNRFEIRPEWRARYARDVMHNVEHVYSLCLPKRRPIRLSPDEHAGYVWLPRDEAASKATSWTNRDAILKLTRAAC